MLNKYRYDLLLGWEALDHDPLPEWQKGQTEGEYLKAAGYYEFGDSIGNHYSWTVKIHAADSKAKVQPEFPYLVEIGNASEGAYVFCSDFLSAAELVRTYASVVTADLLTDVFETVEARLEDERKHTERLQESRRKLRKTG